MSSCIPALLAPLAGPAAIAVATAAGASSTTFVSPLCEDSLQLDTEEIQCVA